MAVSRIEKTIKNIDIECLRISDNEFLSFLFPNLNDEERNQLVVDGNYVDTQLVIGSVDDESNEPYQLLLNQSFLPDYGDFGWYFSGQWDDFVQNRTLNVGDKIRLKWVLEEPRLHLRILDVGYTPTQTRSDFPRLLRECSEFKQFGERINVFRQQQRDQREDEPSISSSDSSNTVVAQAVTTEHDELEEFFEERRILGPVFSQSSSILAIERAMIVDLEFIKAIVAAEEVLLLDPLHREVLHVVDPLRRQLSHKVVNNIGHTDDRDNRQNSTGRDKGEDEPSSCVSSNDVETEQDELEAKFFEERRIFEHKYQKLYQPLYTKVHSSGISNADEIVLSNMSTMLDLVMLDLEEPFVFPPFHEAIREPFDYYSFGQNYIRPLIDFGNSYVGNITLFNEMEEYLQKGHNVILMSNHQTEADPTVIALLLEKTNLHIAENLIYIAGDRVITDPLCKPFSMGRKLLCVYSNKHMLDVLELADVKKRANTRSLKELVLLLRGGSKIIWIAPSGGRDRPDAVTDEWFPAPFDVSAVDNMTRLGEHAGLPRHINPMALLCYDIMPPPSQRYEIVNGVVKVQGITNEVAAEKEADKAAEVIEIGPTEKTAANDDVSGPSSNKVLMKKVRGARLWMKFEKFGESELIEWDKSVILKCAGIPARDLRILGPVFSHSSSIPEEVLLLDPLCREVLLVVDQLRKQLSHKVVNNIRHTDDRDNRKNSTDVLWARTPEPAEGGQQELPFEFQVLKVALEMLCLHFDSSVAELEKHAYPVLDELAHNVSTKNLVRVRSLKSNLAHLPVRVEKVV